MLISSRLTPWQVAPKLSPWKSATHGGASGSSVCLGGLPTHFLVRGDLPVVGSALLGGGMPGPPSLPPGAPPWVRPDVLPRPRLPRLPPTGGGGLSLSGGTGANSSVVEGLLWGTLSDDGRTTAATRMATRRAKRGGYLRAHSDVRVPPADGGWGAPG